MGIMNVLAELHQEPDLKLNLKFEIEVLCKTLNLELNVRYTLKYVDGCIMDMDFVKLSPFADFNRFFRPYALVEKRVNLCTITTF